jgi:hypothetical protein
VHPLKYTRVRCKTDRYKKKGVKRGMIGYVTEVWDDGEAFEVVFSDWETGDSIPVVEMLRKEFDPL